MAAGCGRSDLGRIAWANGFLRSTRSLQLRQERLGLAGEPELGRRVRALVDAAERFQLQAERIRAASVDLALFNAARRGFR